MMQKGEYIVPLEVKSGENVQAKSFKVYRERYEPKLSVRFSLKDLLYNDGLLNIPLTEAFLIEILLKRYI